MDKTAIKATELTEKGAGKHHIGDFLPPEELQKFMEKVSALKFLFVVLFCFAIYFEWQMLRVGTWKNLPKKTLKCVLRVVL